MQLFRYVSSCPLSFAGSEWRLVDFLWKNVPYPSTRPSRTPSAIGRLALLDLGRGPRPSIPSLRVGLDVSRMHNVDRPQLTEILYHSLKLAPYDRAS